MAAALGEANAPPAAAPEEEETPRFSVGELVEVVLQQIDGRVVLEVVLKHGAVLKRLRLLPRLQRELAQLLRLLLELYEMAPAQLAFSVTFQAQ